MTGNGKHTTYKNGDDWGMVDGVVLITLQRVSLGTSVQHVFSPLQRPPVTCQATHVAAVVVPVLAQACEPDACPSSLVKQSQLGGIHGSG